MGRISLGDMCFEPLTGSWRSAAARLVARALSLPSANLVTRAEYAEQLRRIGYVHVQIDDISADVLPGFTEFLRGRGGAWAVFGWIMRLWADGGGRFVHVSGQRPG